MTNGSMERSFGGDIGSAFFVGFSQSRVEKHLKDAPRQLLKHYFISAAKTCDVAFMVLCCLVA
jgi:hypothetical protein